MDAYEPLAESLAHALLRADWRARAMAAAIADVCGGEADWQRRVAIACRLKFRRKPLGEPSTLARCIRRLEAFGVARGAHARLVHPAIEPVELDRPGRAFRVRLPKIETVAELVAWSGLPTRALLHLAEPWRQRRTVTTQLGPYEYRYISKSHGRERLLEVPRPRLRALQRRILDEILAPLPVHGAATGFVRGRGLVDFGRAHAGRAVVLAMDLQDFFTSVPRGRVFRVFRAAGYPEAVARLLANLCLHATPKSVLRGHDVSLRLTAPHLPQGAPTSPALANLCAFGLDVRLGALAASAGATYARYADDLAFSGDRGVERLANRVAVIALEEGFAVNFRKTRVLRASQRQRVAGMVLNAAPSVGRVELERLEATLFNCVRHGPAAQNRDGHPDFRAHLRSRIAWVAQLEPHKAAGLLELFRQIAWPHTAIDRIDPAG